MRLYLVKMMHKGKIKDVFNTVAENDNSLRNRIIEHIKACNSVGIGDFTYDGFEFNTVSGIDDYRITLENIKEVIYE